MFSFGRFGESDDPWFRVGNVAVSTTLFILGLGVFGLLVWLVEGPSRSLSSKFWLLSGIGKEGEVWRFVTWPIFPTERVFWVVITMAIFAMLGSQLEARMGRRAYTSFLLLTTVVPAVLITILTVLFDMAGGVGGLDMLELGVLVGFALSWPNARFWPGIPAWGIAAGIVAIQAFQHMADRNDFALLFLVLIVGTALLLMRGLGFAHEANWIPKIPLPATLGGEGYSAPSRPTKTGRKRGRGSLKAVPPIDPVKQDLDDMEIDVLLDQVANEGLDSLSRDQRKRLEQHAKRMKKRKGS